jgi:protein-tyrosine-phosphatase
LLLKAAAHCADSEMTMTMKVLFLCTGNSARSQIAEGLLRRLGDGVFEAHSAGTSARPAVHPMAIRAMAEQGIDIRTQVPKDVRTYAGQHFDFVITVCDRARESCPVIPGAEMIHWSFPDPAEVHGDEQAMAFRETVLGLKRRIELFVTANSRKKDA